jgi:hypothetical protein
VSDTVRNTTPPSPAQVRPAQAQQALPLDDTHPAAQPTAQPTVASLQALATSNQIRNRTRARTRNRARDQRARRVAPAWHPAARVFTRPATPAHATSAIGADFPLSQQPVQYTSILGITRTILGKYVLERGDTGEPLAIVGAEYATVPHAEAARFLASVLDATCGQTALIDSAALIGHTLTRGGATGSEKLLLSARLPDGLLLDPRGRGDQLDWYLNCVSSLDGRSRFYLGNLPVRVLSGATQAVPDVPSPDGTGPVPLSWACIHKRILDDRLNGAPDHTTRNAAAALTAARAAYHTAAETLIRTHATPDDLGRMITAIHGPPPKGVTGQAQAARRAWQERRDRIMTNGYEHPSQERIAGTAWGHFSAFTLDQRDHTSPRPRGAMTRAQRLAILTVDELGDAQATRQTAALAWTLAWQLTQQD